MRQTNYYLADDNRLIRVSIVDGKIDEVSELECASIVTEEEEKEPEIEGYNTKPKTPIPDIKELPKKKNHLKSKGRQASWNKDEARAMIRANTPAGEIAKLVGTPVGNIYQLKLSMKKKGELKEQEEEDIEVDNHPKARVKRMVAAGETDQAIYNVMHNFMTDEQFREAIAEARS